MATTDSNGIVFLEETDPISPFHTTINTLQQGTSDVISGLKDGSEDIVVIHRVSNTTERDALAAAYGPAANKPLYVDRQDAPAGRQLEKTTNGTDWHTIHALSVDVRRGKTTVTTASDGRATINHGLGKVPTAVICTLYGNADGGATIPSQVVVGTGATATTFPIRVFTAAGGVYASASITVAWEAWA